MKINDRWISWFGLLKMMVAWELTVCVETWTMAGEGGTCLASWEGRGRGKDAITRTCLARVLGGKG